MLYLIIYMFASINDNYTLLNNIENFEDTTKPSVNYITKDEFYTFINKI